MDNTACGIPIVGAFASREWSREENHLCSVCWTRHEVDTGEMKLFERRELEASDPSVYYDPEDSPTDVGEEPDTDPGLS